MFRDRFLPKPDLGASSADANRVSDADLYDFAGVSVAGTHVSSSPTAADVCAGAPRSSASDLWSSALSAGTDVLYPAGISCACPNYCSCPHYCSGSNLPSAAERTAPGANRDLPTGTAAAVANTDGDLSASAAVAPTDTDSNVSPAAVASAADADTDVFASANGAFSDTDGHILAAADSSAADSFANVSSSAHSAGDLRDD